MKKTTTMFGVSTLQNTTNAIPAIQLQVDEFVLLETSGARNKKWSEGITEVLSNRKISIIQPIELSKSEDARIDLILKKIYDFIENHKNKTIYWNVGGGQKAQQIALWKAFEQRVRDGYKDKICYANPETKHIELWYYDDNNNFVSDFSETNVNLSAKEIFKIFGLTTNYDSKHKIYRQRQLLRREQGAYKLMKYSKFRQFFFLVPLSSQKNEELKLKLTKEELEHKINIDKIDKQIKSVIDKKGKEIFYKNEVKNLLPGIRKKIIAEVLENFYKIYEPPEIDIANSELKKVLKEYTDKNIDELVCNYSSLDKILGNKIESQNKNQGFFFEEVLADKIISIIEKQNSNKILEIYRNINIYEKEKKIAEYDILIVTQWGTCIALDAKTFDIKQKDFDARLLNLRKGAGRYVDFIIILPLFEEDLEKDWFPKELQNLAKKLNKNNVKYYSITDTDFKININENNSISIKSINNFLNDLKLI